jgi:hypothetical protein
MRPTLWLERDMFGSVSGRLFADVGHHVTCVLNVCSGGVSFAALVPAFPIWPQGKDYAASALSAALGFLATMVRSERAAGSGNTRPCSQLRSVARGIRRALANSA